ncbi:MAG: tRNA 4-thiouridine(8) synthase ThiI [Deltaproteobacteria bacterium]|nr:tRNA 4-thiouridine(8) synthase ThiI [Deltaproteobacteria bacterium]MBW2199605.1 tRNA 4-thiouridine(8) synthase ThiI [Deltaproteobacteria bacterium]
MDLSSKKVRALGICSGGLDSILSALVLRTQGIAVEWITFETPFFSSIRAREAAALTGIPLTVNNITRIYLEMLKNPPCGYGQHMNPCMDCHALMFRLAGASMQERGFDFLFSGEVLGQRPMSQTWASLRYVEKESGFEGYILRPLSAKKLPETIPEKEGLVKRELLLGISGRSRREQINLAKTFGIRDYPTPAGGCLLTDKGYSRRLKDLFEHQDTYNEADLHLLKYGRHLRLGSNIKIIVGRTKKDNENIVKYFNPAIDTIIKVEKIPGPTLLIPRGAKKDYIVLAATICAGYGKAPNDKPVDVVAVSPHGREVVTVSGIPPSDVKHFLI